MSASGPPNHFGNDHSVTIVGLTPGTTYFVQVECTDPDGNGPTRGAVTSFTTLEAPDTEPPVIVEGPTIEEVTSTSITVVWRTDEPASSGVSYNDGVVFGAVTDPSLLLDHRVVLVDLRPDTTYSLTISCTDGNGNGPTLSGPINVTTNPAGEPTATPTTTPSLTPTRTQTPLRQRPEIPLVSSPFSPAGMVMALLLAAVLAWKAPRGRRGRNH